MIPKKLQSLFNRTFKFRKYNNIVEAAHWAKILLKVSGTTVYELKNLPGNKVVSSFTRLGFASYVSLFIGYLYCTYIIYYEDQTIIRLLHNTKLRRYGDDFERCSSIIFTIITMILTPFKLNGNRVMIQKIVDIDIIIEKAGHIIDYNKLAKTAISVSLGQLIVYCIRLICVYVALSSSISMPVEKMFQVCISDSLAMITIAVYCYQLLILVDRFKWINVTLCEIKARNSWEYKVFVRGKVPANIAKVMELQDRQVCEKIRTCARVYSTLFESCKSTSSLYGLSLLFTMLYYFNYIILYLFYFMEANATGLFHDLKRYFDFLVYTFWEIAIGLGIIFIIIVFSELTVGQVSLLFIKLFCKIVIFLKILKISQSY